MSLFSKFELLSFTPTMVWVMRGTITVSVKSVKFMMSSVQQQSQRLASGGYFTRNIWYGKQMQ
jgi:hypothetical protein